MGIHGIFKQIGPGNRISLAKLSAEHLAAAGRPFRIAVDISIWLFQIQASKGGSNPALRTFYYRLLRLLSLNVHPLFVFDGPNKPLFKRNKKVGGPGVRVASVPEFLAKQLLKQVGFPWHVAPGEAEAECALLQREGVVDAVLSEDVDTLMFGSEVTIRNWSAEDAGKSPTHVNVYKATETKAKSGMDREGMILVALMSGGDYLPEGIPGCGPKLACDAARGGFGTTLCALRRNDTDGMKAWKDQLEDEIISNRSKIFSRKLTKFKMPTDFPNLEVLGYYTHPCVSSEDKISRLRASLQWDQAIDFAALRSFTADAFDWRCLGGAQKFIRNLAPAMLVRELRLGKPADSNLSQEAQEEFEKSMVSAIHSKRNHKSTDGILEYRVTFTAADHVPIDLAAEEKDDDFEPAGGEAVASGQEDLEPGITIAASDSDVSATPKKKRTFKPYDPTIPEKVWIPKDFLQAGCPLLVEIYEASFKDARELFKQKQKARVANEKGGKGGRSKPDRTKSVQANSIMQYGKVTKPIASQASRDSDEDKVESTKKGQDCVAHAQRALNSIGFKLPSTQPDLMAAYIADLSGEPVNTLYHNTAPQEPLSLTDNLMRSEARPFAQFARKSQLSKLEADVQSEGSRLKDVRLQKTPRKKRSPLEMLSTPATQRTLDSYLTPSPVKSGRVQLINLLTSPARPSTPSPSSSKENRGPSGGGGFLLSDDESVSKAVPEPDFLRNLNNVTKRRKRSPLKRHGTAPTRGDDLLHLSMDSDLPDLAFHANANIVEVLDLTSSPSQHLLPFRQSSDRGVCSVNSDLMTQCQQAEIDFGCEDEVVQEIPGLSPLPMQQMPTKLGSGTCTMNFVAAPRSTSSTGARQKKIRAIQERKSRAGAWKEVDADELDHDASLRSWRKSGVEELWMLDD